MKLTSLGGDSHAKIYIPVQKVTIVIILHWGPFCCCFFPVRYILIQSDPSLCLNPDCWYNRTCLAPAVSILIPMMHALRQIVMQKIMTLSSVRINPYPAKWLSDRLFAHSVTWLLVYTQDLWKTVWILISWLPQKPADQDPHFLIEDMYPGLDLAWQELKHIIFNNNV